MKIAYLDCFSGIAGDMLLGALVDAGVEIGRLEAELRRLPLEGWKLVAQRVKRGAISGTLVVVEIVERKHHRSLREILGVIERAGLSPNATERACTMFRRLGAAEAKVHGIGPEEFHFHEVGAVDAIVDIVGANVGMEMLGVEECVCSALNVGGGRIQAEHGVLPAPAPPAMELLRGVPIYSTGIEKELVTPTGAAIASTLAKQFGAIPPMTVHTIGYGAGTFDLTEQPNMLRLFVGDAIVSEVGKHWDDVVAVIEANVDDMNPQIYGYFVEQALAAGALDVFATPMQMKKNRPGQLLTVLCEPAAVNRLIDLIFRETTTIGVRTYEARRRTLEREIVRVETPLGVVRMKVSRLNGRVLNVAPEYEDCRQIAAERGVPLKQVLAEAAFCFQKQGGKTE